MPAVSGVNHSTAVYSPCQTLPIEKPPFTFFNLLDYAKNSIECLCSRRPDNADAESHKIKMKLLGSLCVFFAHGKGSILLKINGESVIDSFNDWIKSHQGMFTYEDQEIIKQYCHELRSIIPYNTEERKKALLDCEIDKINKVADTIFSDIPIIVESE